MDYDFNAASFLSHSYVVFVFKVRIGFTVKASEDIGGSTADLAKKNKGSLSSLNKVTL